MLTAFVVLLTRFPFHPPHLPPPGSSPFTSQRCRGEHGQTTAEYALVLIGAAALALLFIAWATKTDRIGALFDFVMDEITGRAR